MILYGFICGLLLLLTENCAQLQTLNICIAFVQRRPNVFDVDSTLYKCYSNGLCVLCADISIE